MLTTQPFVGEGTSSSAALDHLRECCQMLDKEYGNIRSLNGKFLAKQF